MVYPAFLLVLTLLAVNAGADAAASAPRTSFLQDGAPATSYTAGFGAPLSSQTGSGNGNSGKGPGLPLPHPNHLPGPHPDDRPGPKPGGPGGPDGPGPKPLLPLPHPKEKGGGSSSGTLSPQGSELSPQGSGSSSPPQAAVSSPPLSSPPSPVPNEPVPPPHSSDDVPPPEAASAPEQAAPPSSSSPSPHSASRVIVKGRVNCLGCSTHIGHFDQLIRTRGIEGVNLLLLCPGVSIRATSGHHGLFRIELRQQLPTGFPDECAVSVVTSTLPDSCNVPVGGTKFGLSFDDSSNKTTTYTVSSFEFSPASCTPE